MRFLCLVYGDERTLQTMPVDECLEYDAKLKASEQQAKNFMRVVYMTVKE